jgi:hypothetical protein
MSREVILGFVLGVRMNGVGAGGGCGLRKEVDEGEDDTVPDLKGCIELMDGLRVCCVCIVDGERSW